MLLTQHLPDLTEKYLLIGFGQDVVTARQCATKPLFPFMRSRSEPRCGRVAFMVQVDNQTPDRLSGFNNVRVSAIKGISSSETELKLKSALEKFKRRFPDFHYGVIRENGALGYYIQFIG